MPSVNPLCSHCNSEITNSDFHFIWCQEGFESIDIGPYCPQCFVKVKICSGCQKPKIGDSQIRHYGRGRHFCTECASSLEICAVCENEEAIYKVVNGVKYCKSCYDKKFFTCGVCGEDHKIDGILTDELLLAEYKGLFKKYSKVNRECFDSVRSRFKRYKVSRCKCCDGVYGVSAEGKGGMDYCDHCWETKCNTCECGVRNHKVSSYRVGDDVFKSLCTSCYKKSYVECSACGRHTTKKDSTQVKTCNSDVYIVCPSCTEHRQCPSCLNLKVLDSTNGVCRRCNDIYQDNLCGECGSVCDADGNCRVCNNLRIYNYGLKPHLQFHSTEADTKSKEALYFGFENEMHFDNTTAALKELYKCYDPTFLTAKHDGSLPSGSYEVVTQPMTLSYFNKKNLKGLFSKKPLDHSSCGLHIHVDRRAFISDVHIYKICNFITENTIFADIVAGRTAGEYQSAIKGKVTEVVLKAKKEKRGMRNCRINLTNSATIEFRLFDGCTTEHELRYRVEWLHALIKWSEVTGMSQINVANLVVYIIDNRDKYPNIQRFIQKAEF